MCSFKIISMTDLLFLILSAKGSTASKENEGGHGHLSHKFFPSARTTSKNFSYYLIKKFLGNFIHFSKSATSRYFFVTSELRQLKLTAF